ncbi:MAG: DUF3048 domain-containing protein [Chloroflexi bacterium]|nr:DUF3048 domain-containing protein [Chloroflexota bacterium]
MSRTTLPLSLILFLILLSACNSATNPTTQPPNHPTTLPPAVTLNGPTLTPPPPAVTLISPTDSVQPSATPLAAIGPETYPAGVNPLTGLPADEAALNHRPLAIKISNFPRYVRPQAGLSLADIVFEHYSEGGTTRFTAVFYGNNADRIGPIRSARLIDTVIPEMFRAALVASGSSSGVLQRIAYKDWADVFVAETSGYGCPTLLCPESEDANSLFSSTAAIRQALAAKGFDTRQSFRGVAYLNQPPAGGAAVSTLRVEYSGEAHTEWHYNPVSARYERWSETSATDMQAHFDAANKQQITAANVIVLFVNHVVDFSIPEDFDTDGFTGHFSTEVQLWATGPAWLLRDGQAYQATWVRLNKGDMVGLVDAKNNVIPLKPGNTWYQVVGLYSDSVTDGANWIVRHKSPRDKGDIPGVPSPTPTLEGATPEATPAETPTAAP